MDTITVVLVVIAFGVISFVSIMVSSDVNTEIQADPDLDAEAKAISQQVTDGAPNWLDNGFVLLLVLMWGFLLVSTVFVDSHPAFFAVMVILMLFAFAVIMLLSNVFFDIANDVEFAAVKAELPKIYWINTNLLVVFLVIGGSTLVSLYAKQRFFQ